MKLRFAGLLAALLCLSLLPCSPATAKEKKKAEPAAIGGSKFSVLSPLGTPPAIHLLGMAPRPNGLDGKTIYIVDDGFPGGEVLLNEMAVWFNQNMPGVKVVFRTKAGPFEYEDPHLFAEIKEKADAVIMGMGH
jgi:hypothetical protein